MTGTDITVLRTSQHYSTDSLWLAVCLHYANIFASFIHVKEWRLHSTKCQLKLFLLSLVFLLCSIWNWRFFFAPHTRFVHLLPPSSAELKIHLLNLRIELHQKLWSNSNKTPLLWGSVALVIAKQTRNYRTTQHLSVNCWMGKGRCILATIENDETFALVLQIWQLCNHR